VNLTKVHSTKLTLHLVEGIQIKPKVCLKERALGRDPLQKRPFG